MAEFGQKRPFLYTPKPGGRVSFELAKGKDGRIQELNVAIVGAPKSPSTEAGWLPALAGLADLAIIVCVALGGYRNCGANDRSGPRGTR